MVIVTKYSNYGLELATQAFNKFVVIFAQMGGHLEIPSALGQAVFALLCPPFPILLHLSPWLPQM